MKKLEVDSFTSELFTVNQDDTAIKVGSGGVPVLASPIIVTWVEGLTYQVLLEYCEDNQTTVGTEFNLEHLAPSAVGSQVLVGVVVKKIDKNKITFKFVAQDFDTDETLATGTHTRAFVFIDSFMSKFE